LNEKVGAAAGRRWERQSKTLVLPSQKKSETTTRRLKGEVDVNFQMNTWDFGMAVNCFMDGQRLAIAASGIYNAAMFASEEIENSEK
jgi:hypothetical protein